MDKLRHIPNEDDQWEDDDTFTYDDVVDGSVPITISHGGGEMADLERGLWEDIHGKKKRSVSSLSVFSALILWTEGDGGTPETDGIFFSAVSMASASKWKQ